MMDKETKLQDGWVKDVSIPLPSVENNIADADKLIKVLLDKFNFEHVNIELDILRILPDLLRESQYQIRCSCFYDNKNAFITGLDFSGANNIYGLAIDLGTTKYVLRIIDMTTGEKVLEETRDNPQTSIGTDILTRIHYADQQKTGLKELQELIIEDVNFCLRDLCPKYGFKAEYIRNIVVAGNTAMTHFFLGLNTHWLIREPYIPVVNDPGLYKAQDLDLELHPWSRVLCFPNAGSYFGGDLFAGILYSGLHKRQDIAILVDVGTNAEVVLGNKDWLIACAGAAGPALEEGMSKIGKQAGPGIIDQVYINPDTLEFNLHTIDDLAPKGICGSGVIDLAAQLFLNGLLDFRGKFVPEKSPDRFKEIDEIKYLILVFAQDSATGEDLLIGQPEIDSLIRSKAAMFTILETLISTVGVSFNDISTFYVAGTFGNFINPRSAISIGMLPDLSLDMYQSLGNSSLEGASKVLRSSSAVSELKEIKDKLTYLELNVNLDFMNRFSAAKFLPHTDSSRFPSVSNKDLS